MDNDATIVLITFRDKDGRVAIVRTPVITRKNRGFVKSKDGVIRYLYNQALDLLARIETEGQNKFYTTYFKKKKSGGFRRIDVPCEELKSYMREVNHFFTDGLHFEFPEFVSAYVKKRRCIDAAAKHTGAREIVKLDIKDFFGSCTLESIMESLTIMYPFCLINEEALRTIIKACMIEYDGKYRLPQGAPTSPVLSNLMMIPLDLELSHVDGGATYTRYADDMTFSTKYFKPDYARTVRIIKLVKAIIEAKGLRLNKTKTRIYNLKNGNVPVLGMSVGKEEVKVKNKDKQTIKAAIWNFMADMKAGNAWPVQKVQSLSGRVSYFRGIEPKFINSVLAKYKEKLGLDYYDLVKSIIS